MIERVIEARRRDLGGFEVGRLLPHGQRPMVGPFIFFDHMGPVDFPPGLPRSTDVRPHPHIGLATVTYLFGGEITHRDSLGFEQVIRPGEVNWMTAGRGISHSERFDGLRRTGGFFDGIQAWVALPDADEETDPEFVHVDAGDLPVTPLDGVDIRLIAGSAFGLTSKVETFSPMFYAHAELPAGARVPLPAGYRERAVYVARGRLEIDGGAQGPGRMVLFRPGSDPALTALEPSIVMLLGGEPVGPRIIWWNFVSSSAERIEQAKADWQAGRIPLPAGDKDEFIPLPDGAPAPEPMS
jgi:hypothetical protein